MAKRKRIQSKSIDERIAMKLQELHNCSLREAWRMIKHKRFVRDMSNVAA